MDLLLYGSYQGYIMDLLLCFILDSQESCGVSKTIPRGVLSLILPMKIVNLVEG
ncbi:hypothetical protein C5167_040807 [Papaver somniferum]|uniref:Uncharacterized protein n=1 Tax=Papaver somniferum TaxID=3469 RepID=A0A4Y7IG46_PAPSO|nr:hypothetical protein C5167_040807 [Papaver somniferum]